MTAAAGGAGGPAGRGSRPAAGPGAVARRRGAGGADGRQDERLGDPADIAAAARERFGIPAKPTRQATPWLEVIALGLLVIPFLGWIVGVVLIWISRIWTTRDKLIGTLGGLSWVLAGLGTIMAEAVNLPLSASGSDSPVGSPHIVESTGPSAIEVILIAAPFVLPIAAAVYLALRLRGHANAMPATG